jgi:hypothetical protein
MEGLEVRGIILARELELHLVLIRHHWKRADPTASPDPASAPYASGRFVREGSIGKL